MKTGYGAGENRKLGTAEQRQERLKKRERDRASKLSVQAHAWLVQTVYNSQGKSEVYKAQIFNMLQT